MYVAELNFTQPIDEQAMRDVVDQILPESNIAGLVFETSEGDFPHTIQIFTYDSDTGPTLEQFLAMARMLGTPFITNDVAVGELWDDGYSLICPNGFTTVVRADDEGLANGAIELIPESRRIFKDAQSIPLRPKYRGSLGVGY